MNVILYLFRLGQLIATFGPIAVETALKLKHLAELDPDFQVNVTNLTGEAVTADDETLKIIEEWKAKHGFTTPPPPATMS